MVVQAFIDDSGGKGQTSNFFLAGLVSDSERWAAFSDEWKACMSEIPAIDYFTMKEAAHLTGQFENWKAQTRDNKLRDLARIINKYAVFVTYCGIDLAAHEKTFGRNRPKPFSESYFMPFHVVILGTCIDLWEVSGWREPFEIIFDEQVIFGQRAKRWYPVIREVVRAKEPEAFKIMPVEPMFKDDIHFRPLQAADMFAWCLRRNTDKPDEHSFEWLLEEFGSISEGKYCNYYDSERLENLFAESDRIFRAGEIPKAVVAKYRELWNDAPLRRSPRRNKRLDTPSE